MKEPEQSLWSGRLLNKTLALATLFFCCSFNYTLLAATKDALIITAPGAGVEVVPFLMSYGVLPCSVAFMMGYSRMSDVRARNHHLSFHLLTGMRPNHAAPAAKRQGVCEGASSSDV